MHFDVSDTVSSLPRRAWEDSVKCANPWCESKVRIRWEHCNRCLDQQARHKAAMAAHRLQGKAS